MNFIASALLIFLSPSRNDTSNSDFEIIDTEYEETAFWIFIHIMLEKGWRNLYCEGMPGVFACI